jgi:phenylacetate-CoA ligase
MSPNDVVSMPRTDEILDVCQFHCDIPEIRQHIHRPAWRADALDRQRRLARKWAKERQALHRRTRWDPEQRDEWQLERVSAFVDYAFNTIPFYRELYGRAGFRTGDIVSWEDYNALPIIRKADLIEGFPHRNVLPGIDPETCYGARTSGSTGVPLTVIQDDVHAERWMMHRMRQFELMLGAEMQPRDWTYNVYLSCFKYTSLAGDYPIFSISEDCPPEPIYRHMQKLRPRVLSAFPSFLARLAECAGDLSAIGLGCICTNSESSSRQERDFFEKTFRVPVRDEYSTEELAIVATECSEGRYHILEDHIRVDVANVAPDGLGDIIATDFSNIYMPVIRYAQGDLIELAAPGGTCRCGVTFRHLTRFLGRADQALRSSAIGRVPADRMMNLCDRTLVEYESGVAEFRVVQERLDAIRLMLVLRKGCSAADPTLLEQFRSGLCTLFGTAVDVEVAYLGALPRTASWKRRMIICNVDDAGRTIKRGSQHDAAE